MIEPRSSPLPLECVQHVPTLRRPGSRTVWSTIVGCVVVLAMLFASRVSFADDKTEAQARALQKKAIEEDYLASAFDKAQDKLERAISQCAGDRCSAALRARLRRDLGVVQIGGALDKERGMNNFVEAIRLDPTVGLDPDVRTKDLDAAFAEAKKRATRAAGVVHGTGGQPQGDFQHTPAPEQQVRTPIPVFAEYAGDASVVRVIARYKGLGMTDWKTVPLAKTGEKGWGGLIPCTDVQQGSMLYYLQGFDANDDAVAAGGDRNHPYRVPVRAEKVTEPPHLPNAAPPAQCADTADCPPNFPGCKRPGEVAPREAGEFCEEDSECKSNRCDVSSCAETEAEAAARKKRRKKLWVGISGSLDYTFVPSADDVCKLAPDTFLPTNDQNYYCVRKDGTDYPSRDPLVGKAENDSLVLTKDHGSDKVTGGGALGNVRLLVTFDVALSPNILVGGRFGVVLADYGGNAAGDDGKRFRVPIQGELRGTYLFGADALYREDVVPYVFGGVGVGHFETRIPVQVIERKPGAAPAARDVDAWHLAGPAFVSVGGGGRLAVLSNVALMLGLRASVAFGHAFAPSVGPELGAQVGF